MTEDEGPTTWAVLLHRPAEGQGAAVFGDPRFGAHVGFLQRLLRDGLLVAAGPLPDEPGAGMSIVRFPGADQMDEITALVTSEDPSVTGGLLTVAVRPWVVRMAGGS